MRLAGLRGSNAVCVHCSHANTAPPSRYAALLTRSHPLGMGMQAWPTTRTTMQRPFRSAPQTLTRSLATVTRPVVWWRCLSIPRRLIPCAQSMRMMRWLRRPCLLLWLVLL